ncbi:MAG TPA: Gfo/Idh/MocA family oxidoreductase [Thermomicrobiales bacterium]
MAIDGKRRLRVGIVGAGHWAREAHIPGFRSCDEVDLLAICDVDRKRAAEVATAAGIPAWHGSAPEMLASDTFDLVSVVTPDDVHPTDVRAAIAAGAHVLCEKPLAVTVADARTLARAAAAAGVRTKIGFTFRATPTVMRLRELVASGDLGEPHLLMAFQQNAQFLDPGRPFHWKMDGTRTGGGAIVEYGIHTLDLARWLMGEVTRVCARGRTLVPERPRPDGGTQPVEVDDSTAWLMEFANGATGICHAGWATVGRPPGLELRVFGSRGAAEVFLSDEVPGEEALLVAGTDGRFLPAEIPSRLYKRVPDLGAWWRTWSGHLIRQFVAEIVAGAPPLGPTFADGVRAQELLAAVTTSMREQRWVEVPPTTV